MDRPYDALTGGVAVGGLRTKSDIRVLVCSVLKSIDAPFPRSGFGEVMQRTSLVNFFEVNDALASLLADGMISEQTLEGEAYLTLTDGGREIADRLEGDILLSARETAASAAKELLARKRAAYGAATEIIRLERGYHVRLRISDGSTLMMETLLYASDSLQANRIADAFLTDPAKPYDAFLRALDV